MKHAFQGGQKTSSPISDDQLARREPVCVDLRQIPSIITNMTHVDVGCVPVEPDESQGQTREFEDARRLKMQGKIGISADCGAFRTCLIHGASTCVMSKDARQNKDFGRLRNRSHLPELRRINPSHASNKWGTSRALFLQERNRP
jgi:hypothetical protein